MSLTVVVLAAGRGTRMRSALPKVMHPLAGRPMAAYVMESAQALNPDSLAVVIGHGGEMVRRELGERIAYATQAERLGTGHAVLQAKEAVAGRSRDVLVLYGDTPLVRLETLRLLLERHDSSAAAVTLLTVHLENPSGYGRIVRSAESGAVQAIVEEAEATEEQREIGEINSGILCFRDDWLWTNLAQLQRRPAGEFYLTDLVKAARVQGESVSTLMAQDPLEVMGLDDRVKLSLGEAEMRRRINRHWMLSGVTIVDPEATYIEAGVEIGPDTVIWPNSVVRGQTTIGEGCTIGPGTVIRDSAIGAGCRVELSVVEHSVMEDGSDVGPFGHLRKGSRLGQGAHMGNFGEMKNSTLGPGAKMGHMSYLGDATVGAAANIGAGTITCNYDGERKHPTVIGDGAFIGSDTMLVAPVEIGDGATTGAGSVVTSDVPPDSVAYGVPARIKGKPDRESEVE